MKLVERGVGRVERRLDDEEVDGAEDHDRGDDLDDRVDDGAGAEHRSPPGAVAPTLTEQQVVGEIAAALHRRGLEAGVLDAVAHPVGAGRVALRREAVRVGEREVAVRLDGVDELWPRSSQRSIAGEVVAGRA